jgi:hypothetical protein
MRYRCSREARVVLTGLAAVAAAVFLRFWGRRPGTMSESIQQALR